MDKEKQYYIVINKERKGPYSFEDLRNIELTQETLVWTAGMATWKKLEEVEELCELIKETPPPIPTEHPSVNTKKQKSIQIEISKRKQNYDSLNNNISKKVNAIKKWFAQECVFIFKLICFSIVTSLIIFLGIYIHSLPPQISKANQIAYNEESAKRKALYEKICKEMRYKTDDEIRSILDKNGLHELSLEYNYFNAIKSLDYTADLRKKYLNLKELEEWHLALDTPIKYHIKLPLMKDDFKKLNETMKLEYRKAFGGYAAERIPFFCILTFALIWLGRNIFFSIRWFVRWVTRNK